MTVSKDQLDSLRSSLNQVVGEPQEQRLDEAEEKDEGSEKDDKEAKPKPKKPEELKTLQEVYDQVKKLGEKGETLGPNETERHEKAMEYLEGLLEKLHELLGDREAEAEEGSDDNESSG